MTDVNPVRDPENTKDNDEEDEEDEGQVDAQPLAPAQMQEEPTDTNTLTFKEVWSRSLMYKLILVVAGFLVLVMFIGMVIALSTLRYEGQRVDDQRSTSDGWQNRYTTCNDSLSKCNQNATDLSNQLQKTEADYKTLTAVYKILNETHYNTTIKLNDTLKALASAENTIFYWQLGTGAGGLIGLGAGGFGAYEAYALSNCNKDLTSCNSELSKAKSEILALQEQVRVLTGNVSSMEGQIKQLREELEKAQDKNYELMASLGRCDSNFTDCKKTLSEAEKLVSVYGTRLAYVAQDALNYNDLKARKCILVQEEACYKSTDHKFSRASLDKCKDKTHYFIIFKTKSASFGAYFNDPFPAIGASITDKASFTFSLTNGSIHQLKKVHLGVTLEIPTGDPNPQPMLKIGESEIVISEAPVLPPAKASTEPGKAYEMNAGMETIYNYPPKDFDVITLEIIPTKIDCPNP